VEPTTFTAELWIHGKDGKLVAYELFNISGYQIPLEALLYMHQNQNSVDWLAGLPVETLIRAKVETWYECDYDYDFKATGGWETKLLGWIDTEQTFDANREITEVSMFDLFGL